MNGYRRGPGGAVLLSRQCPDHPTMHALAAHLAVLFSPGHRHAEQVFGEGYEGRFSLLTDLSPEEAFGGDTG